MSLWPRAFVAGMGLAALLLSAAELPALLPEPAPECVGPADGPDWAPVWMATNPAELSAELRAQGAELDVASEAELRRRYEGG